MADILSNANDVLIDLNGELSYLQDDILWEYDATDQELVGASVVFNNSDLGEPSIEKLMNAADVDYIGSFDLTFYFDGTMVHTMNFGTKATRDAIWKDFPLAKRKAFQKLKLVITASAKTTKIYGLELDFSVLRRRRYN
jgi:hypothetical protein